MFRKKKKLTEIHKQTQTEKVNDRRMIMNMPWSHCSVSGSKTVQVL